MHDEIAASAAVRAGRWEDAAAVAVAEDARAREMTDHAEGMRTDEEGMMTDHAEDMRTDEAATTIDEEEEEDMMIDAAAVAVEEEEVAVVVDTTEATVDTTAGPELEATIEAMIAEWTSAAVEERHLLQRNLAMKSADVVAQSLGKG